jgi:spermidine synthase
MEPEVTPPVVYRFLERPTEPQAQQIVGLYRAQGWWQADDDAQERLLERLVAGSHCFVVALEGETVIGMGRAISDGVSDAYIQDLTVRADRRRQGVAKGLLRKLLDRLHRDGLFWTALIAEPGSRGLYQGCGFREMPGATPMLMVKP